MKQVIKGLLTYAAFKAANSLTFKYNSLKVPSGNFGVPRVAMPQIDMERLKDFLSWLDRQGIHYDRGAMNANNLKLYQNEINKDKVLSMIDSVEKDKKSHRPVLVSADGYVIDGSHRVVAMQNLKTSTPTISVIKIDKKGLDALNAVRLYAGARYRNVSGAEERK